MKSTLIRIVALASLTVLISTNAWSQAFMVPVGSSGGSSKPDETNGKPGSLGGSGNAGFAQTRLSSSDGRFTLGFKREAGVRYRIVELTADRSRKEYPAFGRDEVSFYKPRNGRYQYMLEACRAGNNIGLPGTRPPLNCVSEGSAAIVDINLASSVGRDVCGPGDSCGGVDQLQPGQWWNPAKEGHGWDLYWVNDLSSNATGSNPYELTVFWYTYREESVGYKGSSWKPAWLKGNLQEQNGNYTGDLHYCQKINNVVDCDTSNSDAGELTITFSASNTVATFDWTLDNVKFPGFPASGTDSVEFFGDSLPSTAPGPYSHFNGIWNNRINSTILNDDFHYSEFMRDDYWSAVFSFYDDAGLPVWVKSEQHTSYITPAFKFGVTQYVTEGYSPAWNKPANYTLSNFQVASGGFFRQFFDVNDGDVYSALYLPSSRPGSLYLGSSSNYLPLERQTGVSAIWFDVNGDPTATHCSTYVHGSCDLNIGWSLDNDATASVYDNGTVSTLVTTTTETTQGYVYAPLVDDKSHHFTLHAGTSATGDLLAQSATIRISSDVISPTLNSVTIEEGNGFGGQGSPAPGQFGISWTWSGEGTTYFELEYRYGVKGNWVPLSTVNVFQADTSSSIIDTPVQNSDYHFYRVRSCNASECTSWWTSPGDTLSTTTLYVTAAVAEHVVDNNLAQCIQGAVNDPDTTPVTQVTLLKCVGTQGIQNLDGLEVFTSVEHLAFASISFADIDALACTTVDQFNNTVSCYPNLTRIELEQSTITDLTPMASVTALEWLELNGSTLTSLVPITSLPNLSVLQLEDAFVTTLGNWAGSSLEALHAKGSNLTDLSAFSGASSLRFIDVFDAPISTLDHITVAHMPALEELTVKGMFGLSLTPIASASNLKVLNLSENQNTSHGYISPLNNLESLVLDPNVSNIDFVSGKNLSQLHINGVLSGIGSLNALADQYLMANLDLTGVASGVSLAPIMDMLAGHYNIGGLQLNIDLSGADCSEQQQLQDVLASYGHQYSYDPLGCVVPGPTVTGINKVTNLGYTWQSPGQDENLILTWSYPEDQFTTTAGDISSFNIQPVMSSSTIENVSVTNGWQSSWTSMVIDNAAYPGAAYRVQACIGSNCGEWVTTDLTFVGTADFPAPVWQPGAAINQTDNPAFALAWTEVNHSDVDYYEVMELINNFDDYYHGNSVNELHVSGQIFYTENTSIQFERTLKKHSSDPAGNQETARYYRYIVRACSRDTVATDPCGQWSTIQSVTLRYDNDRPKKVTNLEWVEVTGSGFQLRWDYNIINFQDPEKKPDFFFFRNEDNHASAGYLHAQNWDATGWVTDVMTDRGDWRVWACKKNSNTPAVINSSFIPNQLGHICDNIAPGAIIDTDPTTNPNPPDDTVSTPLVPRPGTLANYDCVGNGCSTRSQGGPGEMIPGEWWDPDRSGTGWSFYWANELRYPSLHEDLYKDAYDLIAVWYTYRAIDGDDQWRPVWYFAQLKHVETASSENVYRGSLLYPQGINHPNHNHPAGESHVSGDQHLNIGTITVHYEVPSPDTNIDPNEYVEVVIQANQDRGMYLNLVDGSDTLKLQHFASDNNVAGLCTPSWDDRSDNPIDHYSGMWWNVTPGPNGEAVVDERFAVFNQIQKNYESIQIVFYDDNGEPIWGRADRGTTDSGDCENSSLGETDFDVVTVPYGFDPTGNTPVGFWGGSSDSPLESIVKNEGGIDQLLGRTFHSDNLRRGEIWGKLDLSEILNYDRSGTLDLGTESNPTGKPQSGTYYQKAASFHDIRYFVGESPETVESCHINSTGPGQFTCDISITWFTDGYYPDSFAYYTDDNGVNWNKLTTNVNEPITCDSSVNNTSGFVKEDIACSISSPGSYQFALMKQNWLEAPVSNHTIAMIAKSSVLSVTADSVPAAQGQAVPDSSASNAHAHPGHNSYIGTVGGSGGVSGGAATYTIPIQLPPGRQGMQPAISVNYSSRGGNGVLGMGWSMSGLSSVHRCPQTVAQDTMLDTVTFDDSDRLCLDGQRLMLRTTGDYWSSTAEYQTEIDSYARVRATSNGFEVFSKSGIVRLYETPVIPAGSPTVPLSWFITSETDPAGNDIRYTYSTYGDGEVLVDSIHYTGTAGSAAGNRRVDFHYLSRPDASFSYLSGHRTEQTMRLDRITTHAPVSETDLTIVEVGDYQFSYEQSAATGRTLLNAVSRGAGSSAKPATIFTWDQVAQGHRPRYFDLKDIYDPTSGLDGNSDPQSEPEDAIMPAGMSVYGDLNGDGYSEILYSVDTGATNDSRETYLLSGADLVNGSDDINPLATGNHQLMANSLYPGSAKSDINNDGRIDIIGWSRPATVSPTAPINLLIGSWRGDVDWPANGGMATLENRLEFAEIDTVNSEIIAIDFANYQTYGPRDSLYVTDVNGDGLQDIVIHERQVAEPSCSGSNDNRQLVWYQNTGLIDNMPTFGSRQLIHCMSRSEDEVELMRFAEFFTSIHNPDNFTGIDDIDGNGLPDFRIDRAAYLQNSGDDDVNDGAVMTTRDINGNLSFTFRPYRDPTNPNLDLGTDQFLSNVYYQYGDFNGDGLSDLIYHDQATNVGGVTGNWKIQFNLGAHGSTADIYGPPVDTGSNRGLETWDWCTGSSAQCPGHQWRPKYAASIRVGDIDNDGRDELMIPSIRLYESCVSNSWTSVNPQPRSTQEIVCGDSMYDAVTYSQSYGEHDNGIYEYATLDFDAVGINSGQATVTEQTGLIAAANGLILQDINGDGLTDPMTIIGARYNNLLSIPDQLDLDPITYSRLLLIMQDVHGQSFPLGSAPDEPSTACTDNASTPCSHNNRRIYINIATAQPQQDPWSPKLAPDFMNYSQDGLGNESEWFYAPLSANVSSSHGMPLYSVPQRDAGLGYVEEDDSGQYFYFTSSMRVVSSFEQSNGLGSRNKTEYGYEEAIFNNLGRGFQGFRKVASEYTPAGMTADAIRNISIFHQIFPLAGKLERTYSQLASQPYTAGDAGQGLALSSTAYNWGCRLPQGAPGNPYAGTCYIDSSFDVTYSAAYSLGSGSNTSNRIYQPLLLSTTSNTNDLSAHQSGNSQSINHTAVTSDYDQYGNNTWQETVTIDHGYMTHTQQVVNAYANADTTNWWLDKLLSSEVTSQVSYNQSADSVYQQVDNTPSRFPERPMTLTSRFGWDGTTDQYRKPACQYTVDGTAGGVAGCSINYSTGTKTSYGYNAYGAVTQTTVVAAQPDPFVARTSTLGYSADGYFPKTVTNAKGHQTITDVDPAYGNPTLITSVHPVSNLLTVIDYDDFGAETHRFYPDNNSDDFNATGQHYAPRSSSAISSCSLPGNPNVVFCSTASTDGAPQTVSYLDAVGRVHRTETTSMNDETVVVEMGYNARGDKLFETVPHFESAASSFSSTYQYDELGRVVKKSQPANSGTQYSYYRYDGLITTVKVTSENITNLTSPLICSFIEEQLGSSLCVRRTYLSNGSLYSTTDAHNGITRFWNDGQGNPALIRDAMGSLTAASYNSLGHRTQLFDPNMGHWQFTYNGLGEVLTQLDAKGQSQTFDYDVLGRMLSRGIAGGNLTPTADNWVYDGDVNGVLYQETRTLNPGVAGEYISYKRDYVYDTANSLLTQHSTTLQPFENNTLPVLTVAMLNDSYFARPISISYPNRLQTHLIYDKNGIAITEQEADSTNGQLLRTVQAVTPTGQISQELLGNGVTQLYEYNARTWQMSGVDAAAGQILEIDYIHDVFGNLTQQNIVSSGYVEDFTYDKLHRLQTSSRSGNSQSLVEYDYDPVGNITRKSDYGEGYLYNPSQPNAVKSLTMMDSGQTRMEYDYDDNGNLTKGFKVVANDSQQHLSVVYDGFNKPLTMVRDNAALNFLYGSNNARFYQYDQNNRVTVYLDKIYEQINGITEKYYIGDYAYWSVGGADAGLHFLHKDRLGSVRAITNLGGTLKEDSNRGYDPFGKPRDGDTGDDSAEGLVRDDLTTRGFTQHEHLNSVELIHMNGRAYDYNLGRFLSVDPVIQFPANSQSINPYSYLMNNPMSGIDPTGYMGAIAGMFVARSKAQEEMGLTADERLEMDQQLANDMIAVVLKADELSDYVVPIKGISKKGLKESIEYISEKIKSVFGKRNQGNGKPAGESNVNPNQSSTPSDINSPTDRSQIENHSNADTPRANNQPGGDSPGDSGDVKYHYTDADESSFDNGLWRDTSVTDNPNLSPQEAVEKLGVKSKPDKIVVVKDDGNFVPNKPGVVEPHPLGPGGGTDYVNPNRVDPADIVDIKKIDDVDGR